MKKGNAHWLREQFHRKNTNYKYTVVYLFTNTFFTNSLVHKQKPWEKFCFCLKTLHQVTNTILDNFLTQTHMLPSFPKLYNKFKFMNQGITVYALNTGTSDFMKQR